MKGDLISRKAVIKVLKADYRDCIADPGEGQLIAIGLESAIDIVRDVQADDAAPVAHGNWIMTDMGYGQPDEAYVCSACGEAWFLASGTPEENNMNYCPRCGAKMSEEAANED